MPRWASTGPHPRRHLGRTAPRAAPGGLRSPIPARDDAKHDHRHDRQSGPPEGDPSTSSTAHPVPSDPALWRASPASSSTSGPRWPSSGTTSRAPHRNPLGRPVMSRSLDNTLRVVQLEPTERALCDIRMHAVSLADTPRGSPTCGRRTGGSWPRRASPSSSGPGRNTGPVRGEAVVPRRPWPSVEFTPSCYTHARAVNQVVAGIGHVDHLEIEVRKCTENVILAHPRSPGIDPPTKGRIVNRRSIVVTVESMPKSGGGF